ncbi:TlpA disulfide reductase family protein [Candidatus Laterigemmans baculatus]|uniref:TlpA disulfide reductase family protein n=1 Tax=Candidatus Laterigemmans baculatus TaxID=2770505 RepID=UPI0013DD1710|nr:TlpA disulfide reductase family protein [Candidatus Laterigemmans baculatus]
MRISILFGALFTAAVVAAPVRAEGPGADGPRTDVAEVLKLHRGDFAAGRLVDHPRGDELAWQHPAFDGKFIFPFRTVTSATFAAPDKTASTGASRTGASRHWAGGDFCAELTNGDRWYGSVAGIDSESLTIRSREQGTLAIERERLRRLFRWDDGRAIAYSGPGALSDWQQSVGEGQPTEEQPIDEQNGWRDQGSALRTDRELASIYADIGLPPQAEIQLAVSWTGSPNFVVAIGVDDTPASLQHALRLEVWNQTVVLVREAEQTADVVALGTLAEFDDQLNLTLTLDQTSGRTVVHAASGRKLGELQLRVNAQPALPGIRFQNISGNIQLDSLQVIRGPSGPGSTQSAELANPRSDRADAVRFQLRGGGAVRGRWLRAEAARWIVADEDQERVIDPAAVVAIAFPNPEASTRGATTRNASQGGQPDDRRGRLRVVTYSGIHATGSLQKVEAGALYLEPDGVGGAVPLRVADLRLLDTAAASTAASTTGQATTERAGTERAGTVDSSASLWTQPRENRSSSDQSSERSDPESAADEASQASGRIGRLELVETRLHGRLVDAEATEATSGLRFQPLDSLNSAAFRPHASGRLVYRDHHSESRRSRSRPAPVPRAPAPGMPAPGMPAAGVPAAGVANPDLLGAFAGVLGGSESGPPPQLSGPRLHLRSGDVLPCELKEIGTAGVVFESSVVGATELPHESIRAIALTPADLANLDATKRERLLTVPRMRKATPPSHLIISTDGDFLRGRVLSLDAQTLRVENRLETIDIPRHVVSQILWFHPDELADPAAKPQTAAPSDSPQNLPAQQGLRVQALHRSGMRLSCEPRQVGGGELIGENPQLGLCLLRIAEIDQLRIGDAIEASLTDSPYHPWRLVHAPEPKDPQAADSLAMGAGGVDSPLVGTAAPEFDLELLSGGTFRLSEQRGKVVVLDFWATWCGPCVESMPEVEAAVAAFADRGVILVAVNLQEGAEQIRGALERLQRSPPVALDSDGLVASLYHAVAIPQTVVIDREGRVMRLFIGGGPKLGEHLRTALEEATEEP